MDAAAAAAARLPGRPRPTLDARLGRACPGPRGGTRPPSAGCARASAPTWPTAPGLVAECVVAGPGPGGLELAVRARRRGAAPGPDDHRRPGHPQGRPGRAGRRGDDRGRRRPHRALGRGALRARSGGEPRGERSLARWRSTAREAAKQSRRAWIPEVTDAASAAGVAQLIAKAACAIVLEPGAASGLGRLSLPESGDLLVVVGPEGGITDAGERGLPRGRRHRLPTGTHRAADLDRRDRGRRRPAQPLRPLVLSLLRARLGIR